MKCPKCGYLMDELCVCPTPQEKEAAQRLISSAAEATELMTDDYLELKLKIAAVKMPS